MSHFWINIGFIFVFNIKLPARIYLTSPLPRAAVKRCGCVFLRSQRSVNPPEHVKASRRPLSSNIANMSEKKQTVDLGLLEEDDEFEEFPAEDWTGLDEDEDAHVWEDNWDDDNVEDDFSNQLRAELEKHGYKMETS
uniref:26S proteasome complex subunit SEM1 n=1 Tax=Takifugu rubripes TaxID=31033 RepID=A0A3B5KET2_TAKRU